MMPQREDWVSGSHDAVLLEPARASKELVPGQCHLPLKESLLSQYLLILLRYPECHMLGYSYLRKRSSVGLHAMSLPELWEVSLVFSFLV